MSLWIDNLLKKHPSIRWKVRINCILVILLSISCIAGHVTNTHLLYDAGLNLGMSAITAVCNLLLSSAILLIVPEADHGAT